MTVQTLTSRTASTPDEWLLARYDRNQDGFGEVFTRPVYQVMDCHGGDCVPNEYGECFEWCGAASWPMPYEGDELNEADDDADELGETA